MKTFKIYPENFPFLLKKISQLPPSLDCAGAPPPPDDMKFLCVIGARRFSEYGNQVCRQLIQGLSGYPIVIVSGMALGIDSIAHEAALMAGLRTIAFPGSGLSKRVLYPPSHLPLAERIVSSGNTLLSPFNYDQKKSGTQWTFPVRNRLMAGISHATLIIEGRKGSGTLLTADYALGFNRDVLIVPGSIFDELSYGPHLLYKNGAIPVTNSEEILNVLGFEIGNAEPEDAGRTLKLENFALNQFEIKIMTELQVSPSSSTELIQKTGITTSQFNMTISELELKGLILSTDGIYKQILNFNKVM